VSILFTRAIQKNMMIPLFGGWNQENNASRIGLAEHLPPSDHAELSGHEQMMKRARRQLQVV